MANEESDLPRGDDTGLDPEIKDLEVEETWIDPRYTKVIFLISHGELHTSFSVWVGENG
jgi:hypothetical protein